MICPRCAETQPRYSAEGAERPAARDSNSSGERGMEYRRGARPIALGTLKVLRYLQTRGYQECIRLQLQLSTRAEVEEVLQQYLVYLLERRLKSVEFLDLLRGQVAPSADL